MPTYSFLCEKHGEFTLTVPVSRHQDHPPCPQNKCARETVQTYTPDRPKNWSIRAIVVHVGADGQYRLPGHANAKVPKGFNKIELTTLSEITKFERKMNQQLSGEAERHLDNQERHFSAMQSKQRGELRMKMQSMSQFGKDFAQLCMDQNNKRQRKPADVGFQVDILNNNNSSRDIFRDKETGWKPVRWV